MNIKMKMLIIEKFGSQANFSMIVNEDESAISRVIWGRRLLNIEQQKKWAKFLGCKPEELFPSND
jgi:hypothetical protein